MKLQNSKLVMAALLSVGFCAAVEATGAVGLTARDSMSQVVLGIPAATQPSAQSALDADILGTTPAISQYQVIIDKNIFSRVHPLPPGSENGKKDQEEPPGNVQVQVRYVLTGVVLLAGENASVAFFEDPISRQVQTVHVGERAGIGMVSQIALDRVIWQADGRSQEIALGMTVPGAAPVGTAAGSQATQPAAGTGAASPTPADRMIEILKANRVRELGGNPGAAGIQRQ